MIYNLTVDSAGSLWVGTASGLCRYDPSADHFTCYQHNPNDSAQPER